MNNISSFTGFPAEGLKFLAGLAKNNNRAWFEARKQVYLDSLLAPAQAFVVALGGRLKSISQGIQFDPRSNGAGSILRIYRDVRFSKDKSPYNTYVRMVFWEGPLKKTENPSFFIGVEADGARVYAGMHMFPKPLLETYRKAVADKKRGVELERAVEEIKKGGKYEVGGEAYKRVPAGYEPDHPRADLLRYGGLYALSPLIPPAVVKTPELVDVCFDHCRTMAPVHRWLVKIVVG